LLVRPNEKKKTLQSDRFGDADAEMAADDGGMLLGNMDLSYLGVHSIWTNDLGNILQAYHTMALALQDT
jgi:hypothetical protein